MKGKMKLIGFAACLISCTSLAVAQENSEPQERQQHEQRLPREAPNPEKIATQMTDQMKESLQLTEKQYKKIYKLNLKEQKEHFKTMQSSGEQRPPMGGPGMRGGRPPMGGGGEPPIMGSGNTPGGMEGRPMMDREQKQDSADSFQKAAEAKEKKIKKILTKEQYEKWQAEQATARQQIPQMRMHRGNHPDKI